MIPWKSASGIGFIKGFGDWDFMRILGETSSGRRSPYRQECAQDQAILTTFATQPRRRRADVAPRSRRRRVDVLLTWRPATPQRRPATRRVGRRTRRNPYRIKHFTLLLRRSCADVASTPSRRPSAAAPAGTRPGSSISHDFCDAAAPTACHAAAAACHAAAAACHAAAAACHASAAACCAAAAACCVAAAACHASAAACCAAAAACHAAAAACCAAAAACCAAAAACHASAAACHTADAACHAAEAACRRGGLSHGGCDGREVQYGA